MVGPFALAPKATMSARALPLARELTARGHRVTLILPPWDNPKESGRRYTSAGVAIENIVLPRRFTTAGIVYRLQTALRAAAPDVIHLFKPKGYGALAVVGLRRRFPLVVDTDDWEGRGGWNEVNSYSPTQRLLFDWQERTVPRLARAVTVASHTLETRVWSFGVPTTRTIYLPNGLSRHQHAGWPAPPEAVATPRAELGLGRAPVILLYTRFVEFAPARAVALFARVHAAIPEARLLVLGKGFRREEEAFLAEARRAGLAGAVTHVPWVAREELPRYLGLGDVAILPYDDTPINRAKCSVKTLDLMAAARPIVADAVGQNRDYLVHGVSGLLTPPGDLEGFGAAVTALLRDRARRAALGEAARARAWAEFDWSRLADHAETAYALAPRGTHTQRSAAR